MTTLLQGQFPLLLHFEGADNPHDLRDLLIREGQV
jgi:hypothetical protein